jgi:4-hydroxy-tetrahydrodipicolinate synthase
MGTNGVGPSDHRRVALHAVQGRDGEELDLDAHHGIITHIVSALDRRLLFLTSGNGEFWSLTLEERKSLLEIGIEVARA